MFPYLNLLETKTVYENIALLLSRNHINEKEIEKHVTVTAYGLETDSLLNRYPGECSGGQRQLAVIWRVLINNP